ncbi:MAG: DUF6992 family protein [Flammeovirgaceae bacterium]
MRHITYRFLFILILLVAAHTGQAQNTLSQMNQLRVKTNQSGMLALGAWSVGNILVGVNRFDKQTENQYFYRMNMYWNIVNLGIATSGYLNAIGESFENLTDEEKIKKQQKIEKLLLINSGLDIAYMMGGLYLQERGRNQESRRLRGFGKSLIMQGGFLLLFDGILYLKHTSNRKKYGKYEIIPAATGNGVGLIFRLR